MPDTRPLLRFASFAILSTLLSFTACLTAAPDWTINPTALGSSDQDGRLAIALPMGPAAGSAPEFGFQLQLVHTTTQQKMKASQRDARVDLLRKASGQPSIERPKPKAGEKPDDPPVTMWRSGWVIPQLTSFLYPANRDRLIWRPPGGGEIIFTREEMDAKRYTPEGWYCAESGPGAYQISDHDGWTWFYQNGLPATLTAPSGRYFEFTHEQGLLTKIVQKLSTKQQGINQDVLRVYYDAQRRPVRLLAGTLEHRLIYDKLTGHLIAWQSTGLGLALNAAAEREAVNETRPETDPALNLDLGTPTADGRALGSVRFAYPTDVLEAMRLPNGKIVRFKWDLGKGLLLADADAKYSLSGDTLTRTDRAGRSTSIRLDERRAELITTGPDGSRSVTAYQRRAAGRGLLRERRDSQGNVLARIDYNTRHLPIRVRTLGEPEIRNIYDDRDRLIEVWRAPGVALDGDDSPDSPVKGQLIRRLTYDGASRQPATSNDASGRTTRFGYDEFGQIVSIAAPDGGTTRMRYDTWGRLLERELPTGTNRELFKYDDQGRIAEHTTADGRIVTYTYDNAGRLGQRTENGVVYTHRYDDFGRPTEVLRNLKPWWKWSYSSLVPTLYPPEKAPKSWRPWPAPTLLQVVAFTDDQGFTTRRHYDADGRLVLVINPLGEQTAYRYNAVGEPVGWVDGRRHALVLERDNAGRIVRQENALGQVLTWKYDGAGRLSERRNGVQTARYDYDVAGRLTSIDYGAGQRVDYLRDDYGRLIGATTAEVATRYAYDELDRVIRVEQRPRDGEPSGLAYTYALGGQKSAVTLLRPTLSGALEPGDTTITAYDQLGRITSIEVDGKREATHRYDPKTMRLATKAVGNGLNYRYDYDLEGRMTQLAVFAADGSPRQTLSYVWDEHGLLAKRVLQRTAQQNANASSAPPPTVELVYNYDALNRLASVSSPQDERQNRRYAYDEAGNLIENRSPDNWLTMEYDAANQLVVRHEKPGDENAAPGPETRFAYDAAGRMIREQVGGQVERSFTYGYLDKVMKIDRPGGRTADYAYDAAGMLVRKNVVPGASGQPDAGPEQETWVWDGLALVQRGNDYYVNEPHLAGGQTLLSKPLETPTQ